MLASTRPGYWLLMILAYRPLITTFFPDHEMNQRVHDLTPRLATVLGCLSLLSLGAAPSEKSPAPAPAAAPTVALSCDAILDAAGDKIGVGLSSGRARVELEIKPRSGSMRRRSLEVKSAKEEGLLRTRVLLVAPSEVAGTAFLLREVKAGADENFLFLPALGKVRRITGRAREGSFMGTDFSYEDLEVRSRKDTVCTRLKDETLEGQPVYRLSTRPRSPESTGSYSRAEMWVHQKTLVPVKVELYDRKDELLKVLEVKRLQKKSGRWLAAESVMTNVQRHTSTRMVLSELDLDATFEAVEFTAQALER